MKKGFLGLLGIGWLFASAACGGLTTADCAGDPACELLVDPDFEAEMSARGLSGGAMTLGELEDVYALLERYIGSSTVERLSSARLMFCEKYLHSLLYDQSNTAKDGAEVASTLQDFAALSDWEAEYSGYLDFQSLNPDHRQFVVFEDISYLIYKTGEGFFTYEVGTNPVIEVVLEVPAGCLRIEGVRYDSPALVYERILSGYYNGSDEPIANAEGIVAQHSTGPYVELVVYDIEADFLLGMWASCFTGTPESMGIAISFYQGEAGYLGRVRFEQPGYTLEGDFRTFYDSVILTPPLAEGLEWIVASAWLDEYSPFVPDFDYHF